VEVLELKENVEEKTAGNIKTHKEIPTNKSSSNK
jgi:hypothetical protein